MTGSALNEILPVDNVCSISFTKIMNLFSLLNLMNTVLVNYALQIYNSYYFHCWQRYTIATGLLYLLYANKIWHRNLKSSLTQVRKPVELERAPCGEELLESARQPVEREVAHSEGAQEVRLCGAVAERVERPAARGMYACAPRSQFNFNLQSRCDSSNHRKYNLECYLSIMYKI